MSHSDTFVCLSAYKQTQFPAILFLLLSSLFQDFKGEMRQGQDMVNNATQQGERVMATTAPRGQEAIVKEIQNLKEDWNTFASSVNEMESNLESCIGNWDDLDEEYQRFLQWIDRMDSRLKGLMENKPDEQRKKQQLMEGEVILVLFSHF